MAASTKSIQIGVIAEDNSDVQVLDALTAKLIKKNSYSILKFVGHGCGKVKRKCGAWANDLYKRGCSVLVLLHDRDKNDEGTLRAELESLVSACSITAKIVLIPIEELEAWLLCDAAAIQAIFKMKALPTVPNNPETVVDPKEFLGKLVSTKSDAEYVNTVHNLRLAQNMNVSTLTRCASFSKYDAFITPLFPKASRLSR